MVTWTVSPAVTVGGSNVNETISAVPVPPHAAWAGLDSATTLPQITASTATIRTNLYMGAPCSCTAKGRRLAPGNCSSAGAAAIDRQASLDSTVLVKTTTGYYLRPSMP